MTKPGERRPVVAEDLTRLRWPIEPAITSDGERVAFVVSGPHAELDRLTYELHIRDRTTEQTARVGLETTCRRPRFSANGEWLAFLTDSLDGQRLAVADGNGADVRTLGHTPIADYDWSPAGDHLAIARQFYGSSGADASPTQPPTERLSSLSIATLDGAERAVDFAAPVSTVRWSPDGTKLAFVSQAPTRGDANNAETDEGLTALWVYELRDASVRLVYRWRGPIKCCEWSPDGLSIAVLGHPNGAAGWHNDEIWLARPDTPAPPLQLTPGFDRSVGQVVRGDDERGIGGATMCWSADGAAIYALVAFGGRSSLVRFGLDGQHREVIAGERSVLAFAGPTASGEFVFSWSNADNPGELSYAADGAESQITRLNDEWLAEVCLARTTALQASASADPSAGREFDVEGWLSEPAEPIAGGATGVRSAPLVVQVHGGPHYPVGSRFSFDAHRLAGLGLCLLRSNPRGSQGYGASFASATTADWGGGALRDIVALTNVAAARPGVDHDRAAIMGESYGGFMTNHAISKTDRFIAGVSENGISDVLSLAQGPRGPSFWHLEFDANPDKDPTRFVAASPLEAVASITVPLLLVHAEEDDNCLIAQSEAMYTALRSLDRPVEMMRIPGEGHFINVFGRPSRRIARTRAIDAFLERHLFADDT